MRKILFPVDGSDYSRATLQWAALFLDNMDSSIYLLIVAESLDMDYSLERMDTILTEAKEWLESCGFHVVQTDYVVNRKAAEVICDYAKSEGIDHIIIGSHGQTVAQIIVGSVSREVLEKASVPVLVIKNTRIPSMEISSPGELRLSQCPPRGKILKVLMPVDGELTAKTLLPLLEGLLDRKTTHVYLFHAADTTSENPYTLNKQLEEAHNILAANRADLKEQGYTVMEGEARIGFPVSEICKYANEKGIDQIALASRNRSNIEKFLFGSVSTGLMKEARQPVLVFGIGPKAVLKISHSDQLHLYKGAGKQ